MRIVKALWLAAVVVTWSSTAWQGKTAIADRPFSLQARKIDRSATAKGPAVAAMGSVNSIVMEYEFGKPIAAKQGQYTRLTLSGTKAYLRAGAPIVPVRPVTLVIPRGKKVVATRVVALEVVELPETVQLPPAQKAYPLSQAALARRTPPDPVIYSQATPWPGFHYQKAGVQWKRGYELVTINLFPLQYVPATGKVSYCRKLRLEVDWADSDRHIGKLRSSPTIRNTLARRVDNPTALQSYLEPSSSASPTTLESVPTGAVSQLPGGPYDYVIVTNAALENATGPWNLQALRDARISSGLSATIVTTEWIYANYDGTRPSGGEDNQTRIRNFLIDAYQTWGTQYALLAGTHAIIPARTFYNDGEEIPADLYYGCVDPPECTFDANANGRYGEDIDGVYRDVDLLAEIYVGRAPVDSEGEVENFVEKTLTYNTTQNTYLPRISMLGELMGTFGGGEMFAKDMMEQIRLGACADGYCTTGFENHTREDFYEFDTTQNLYDADTWPQRWPKGDLINLINSGVHVLNHLGHANITYGMKLFTSDLPGLTNTDYFFAYSQGCLSGAFDNTDCFAEVITTMEHGAFAVIMNSRFGWFMPESTDGPSHRFDRQFWDAVLAEDMIEMGRANQDSKEDNLWDIDSPNAIRWCYYTINLFGDPALPFRFQTGPPGDSDNDGVMDAADFCPGTTAGAPVDTNGCADVQVDADSDGFCDPTAPSVGPSNCVWGSDPCTGGSTTNCHDNCPITSNSDQADADSDSVGEVCDSCPGTPEGMLVGPSGCPLPIPGDFDGDYDVDQEDFGHLQVCLTGAGEPQDDPACAGAKLDGDEDVDGTDIGIFLNCMTGPSIIGDQHCAD